MLSVARPSRRHAGGAIESIGRIAVRSLHAELALSPKPGLVSPLDSGSHRDMDATTFVRSLFALRGYFGDIAVAGSRWAAFAELQRLGIAAEHRMLAATGGVNTHRGAIFGIGLLAAAAGWVSARGESLADRHLGQTVEYLWGASIAAAVPNSYRNPSHGRKAARDYGAGGARGEAIRGYPTLFELGLPSLREALGRTGSMRLALVQTLFRLISRVQDTNLLYRGGAWGLRTAQRAARDFLRAGGVYRPDWEQHALAIHGEFVDLNLSPGGSADLLAATWFVYHAQRQPA